MHRRLLLLCALAWCAISAESATAQPIFTHAHSVEFVANNASLVIVARAIDVEATDDRGSSVVTFAVDEVLKGGHEDRRRLTVAQPVRVVQEWQDGFRPIIVATKDGKTAHATIDLGSDSLAEITADLTVLKKPEEVLRCFRETIRRSPGVTSTLRNGLRAPPEIRAQAKKWREYHGLLVIVPVDESLEKLARKFVLSADYIQRCDGVRALQFFRSDENIARAKSLLDDPGYAVNRWAEDGVLVEERVYGVRVGAYETLRHWGIDVEKPRTRERAPLEKGKQSAPPEDAPRVPPEVVARVKAECGWAGFSHRRKQRGLSVLEHFQTIYDDDLAALRELTDVTDIALEGGFSERGIAHLRGLEHIEFVYLHWSTDISDGVLENLSTLPNLRELHLQNNNPQRITQRGIDALARLTKLERLSLQGVPIADADMRYIAAMPNLRVLRISSGALTKAGVERLQALKKLRVLALDGSPIGDRGLEAIAPMHKLQRLSLARVGIQGEGLRHLSGLLNLDWLCLPGNEIDDADLQALKPLGKLKQLDLAGNPITDKSIATLAAFRRLQFVRLERSQVTDEGIAKLEAISPGKVTKATSIQDVDRDGEGELASRAPRAPRPWQRCSDETRPR